MSELEKIVAQLWEAEGKAKELVEEAKQKSELLLKQAEGDFDAMRAAKLEEAKKEAETALSKAHEEAHKEADILLKKSEAERAEQKAVFENKINSAVETVVAKCIAKYKSRAVI